MTRRGSCCCVNSLSRHDCCLRVIHAYFLLCLSWSVCDQTHQIVLGGRGVARCPFISSLARWSLCLRVMHATSIEYQLCQCHLSNKLSYMPLNCIPTRNRKPVMPPSRIRVRSDNFSWVPFASSVGQSCQTIHTMPAEIAGNTQNHILRDGVTGTRLLGLFSLPVPRVSQGKIHTQDSHLTYQHPSHNHAFDYSKNVLLVYQCLHFASVHIALDNQGF